LWSKRLVEIAKEHDACIALEGLENVKENDDHDIKSQRKNYSYGAIKGFELGRVVTKRNVVGLLEHSAERAREVEVRASERGFRVAWSPDGLASKGVKSRPNAKNSRYDQVVYERLKL
jgi:hypothetical protein